MEADAVVVAAGASQLGLERGRVADGFEVGVLRFDVPEEALDPGQHGRREAAQAIKSLGPDRKPGS